MAAIFGKLFLFVYSASFIVSRIFFSVCLFVWYFRFRTTNTISRATREWKQRKRALLVLSHESKNLPKQTRRIIYFLVKFVCECVWSSFFLIFSILILSIYVRRANVLIGYFKKKFIIRRIHVFRVVWCVIFDKKQTNV